MLKRLPLWSSSFSCIPFFSSAFSFSFSSSCRENCFPFPSSKPPIPKKVPFTVSAHGKTWDDPYRWMSNVDDPDLLDYLNKENSYAESFMADTAGLQSRLLEEMKSRMPPRVSTPPERWGPWMYYQYIPEGKEYPVLCRRLGSHSGFFQKLFSYAKGSGADEVLLDWNEIAEQFGFVHIGTCRVSPDHKFLAYTLDTTGGESFVLQIKDLTTGCILPKPGVEGVVSLAWSTDSSTLLYTVSDDTQRPNRVLCTRLGSDSTDDLLFTENDRGCCVDITSTKDGNYITVYVINAANPREGLQCVQKRVPGVQYFLEHHHGFFYVLTNAPLEGTGLIVEGYHLARCRAEGLPLANWQLQDVILPGQDIIFEDMDIFNGHLVLFLQKRGYPMICSINMPIDVDFKWPVNVEDLNPWFFPQPSYFCSIVPGSNHDFMTNIFRVVVSSPVVPDMIVDYDMLKKKFTIVHQEEIVGTSDTGSASFDYIGHAELSDMQTYQDKLIKNVEGFQSWSILSEAFACERREVPSHDGVKIQLTILYSRKGRKNSQSPGLLHGYGAYGEVLDKSWHSDLVSLLDRGWVVAYADVRGGGGGGMSWHHAGTRLNKLNSMHDFVACGMYLINEGYVHRNLLCAIGFSAGGLLVGAAINTYPYLFCAAILKVPFLDICNTLLDPRLPLTILDHEEFGDPRTQTDFDYIHSYSPYDNIAAGVCHPSMLVTASLHDSRVGVWEAAKWVARVRDITCPSCSCSVILKTNMSGGHFGEGGRFQQCEEVAFEYAFLMKVIGMLDGKEAQVS